MEDGYYQWESEDAVVEVHFTSKPKKPKRNPVWALLPPVGFVTLGIACWAKKTALLSAAAIPFLG